MKKYLGISMDRWRDEYKLDKNLNGSFDISWWVSHGVKGLTIMDSIRLHKQVIFNELNGIGQSSWDL